MCTTSLKYCTVSEPLFPRSPFSYWYKSDQWRRTEQTMATRALSVTSAHWRQFCFVLFVFLWPEDSHGNMNRSLWRVALGGRRKCFLSFGEPILPLQQRHTLAVCSSKTAHLRHEYTRTHMDRHTECSKPVQTGSALPGEIMWCTAYISRGLLFTRLCN